MKYHIWNEGCQIKRADSQRVGSSLEHLGFTPLPVISKKRCYCFKHLRGTPVAEDKALGRVTSCVHSKEKNPDLLSSDGLSGRRARRGKTAANSFVDVFSSPPDPGPLFSILRPGRDPHHWNR